MCKSKELSGEGYVGQGDLDEWKGLKDWVRGGSGHLGRASEAWNSWSISRARIFISGSKFCVKFS